MESSRALLEAVGYEGLCTCEFLIERDGTAWFLEVNPRLQVEHPVSEEITGIDAVELQLLIAQGKELSTDIARSGHSIEFRITCEDPAAGMRPHGGLISTLQWPEGAGIRIDSGIRNGDNVSASFDPMLAKIIVTASTRERALARAKRALSECQVQGVPTPLELYAEILNAPSFVHAKHHTRWLEEDFLSTWKAPSRAATDAEPRPAECLEQVVIEVDGKRTVLGLPGALLRNASTANPTLKRAAQRLRHATRKVQKKIEGNNDGSICAPTQAVVTRVAISTGEYVEEGQLLAVIEAMKMENYITATRKGFITALNIEVGDSVEEGQELLIIKEKQQ